MNKNSRFQRKSTFTSSTPSEVVPRTELRSPMSRISSMKSILLNEMPFSQHIFGDELDIGSKPNSATVFHSQKWSFEPQFQTQEKNSDIKSTKSGNKNPFVQAVLACAQKIKEQSPSPKQKIEELDVDHDGLLDDQITTFRLIKKNSRNQLLQECIDTLI